MASPAAQANGTARGVDLAALEGLQMALTESLAVVRCAAARSTAATITLRKSSCAISLRGRPCPPCRAGATLYSQGQVSLSTPVSPADSFTSQLTRQAKYAISYSVMQTYSTAQAARLIGIDRVTLQRWLISRRVKEPKKVAAGSVEIRVWTDQDVERLRKFKKENYRKGRGRKPKLKR